MPSQVQKAERKTKQQAVIWETFYSMCNHPTADMVYEAVAQKDSSVGRATVYRALHRFVEKGKAICVPVYDGADRYDKTVAPHAHAKCTRCGSVLDVKVEGELPPLLQNENFVACGGAILYYGYCAACREYNTQK